MDALLLKSKQCSTSQVFKNVSWDWEWSKLAYF